MYKYALILPCVLLLHVSISQANNYNDLPDDISSMNRLQLIDDLYDIEESVKDYKRDQVDLQNYIRQLFLLIWRLPLLDLSTLHRYDSYNDKLISGGPRANASECQRKLKVLYDQLSLEQLNGSSLIDNSNNYRLLNLLDSFGRPSASFLRGDILWLGDYDQCLKSRYNYDSSTRATSASRYCLAHVRWPNWKQTDGFKEWKYATIKSAICIPIECDSISAEQNDNKQIIRKLMDLQYGSAYKRFELGDIYCLPDEESSLTQWWHNSAAICCVILFALWMSIIIICTFLDLYGGGNIKDRSDVIDMFSIIRNTSKLFDTSNASETKPDKSSCLASHLDTHQSDGDCGQCALVLLTPTSNKEEYSKDCSNKHNTVIDLNYLHCIKVIFLFIVMRVHMFIMTSQHGRIYDSFISFDMFDKYHIYFAALGVNVFFMMTGTITAYTLFNRFPIASLEKSTITATLTTTTSSLHQKERTAVSKSHHILLKPKFWLVFCINRYLRFMPLIVFLTLIMKYLAKYLGHGPLWDYGTSTGTNGHACREGSWLYTLFGLMNFELVYDLCVPSSWYVAIDLQCAILVTPILIIAYIRAPKVTFSVCLVFLWLLYGFQFFLTKTYIPDILRKYTKYHPNKFATFALFFHEQVWIYTDTVPRAIYYGMGITTGYMLHVWESSRMNAKDYDKQKLIFCRLIDTFRKPILSNWIAISVLFASIYIPGLSLSYIPKSYLILFDSIYVAHIGLFITAIMYALVVPIILIQLSTRSLGSNYTFRKFLNWPGWIPLSRINLSFMLIDTITLMLYYLRYQRTMILDIDTRVIITIAMSFIIYICAFLVHIIFAAPLRSCTGLIEKKVLLFCGMTKR